MTDDLERNGPRNGGGLVVPMLHHVEEKLDDQEKYFERVLSEKSQAHTQEHALIEKALDRAQLLREEALAQARQVVNDRLEKLNALRSEVEKDRGLFIREDTFQALMREVATEQQRTRENFDAYKKDQEEKRLKREEEVRAERKTADDEEKARRRTLTLTLISFGLTIAGLAIAVLTR